MVDMCLSTRGLVVELFGESMKENNVGFTPNVNSR